MTETAEMRLQLGRDVFDYQQLTACLAQPAIIKPARITAANLAPRIILNTFISGASILPSLPDMGGPGIDLAARSLSEGSVNLDGGLQRPL